jgi:hypothetical protein
MHKIETKATRHEEKGVCITGLTTSEIVPLKIQLFDICGIPGAENVEFVLGCDAVQTSK